MIGAFGRPLAGVLYCVQWLIARAMAIDAQWPGISKYFYVELGGIRTWPLWQPTLAPPSGPPLAGGGGGGPGVRHWGLELPGLSQGLSRFHCTPLGRDSGYTSNAQD